MAEEGGARKQKPLTFAGKKNFLEARLTILKHKFERATTMR